MIGNGINVRVSKRTRMTDRILRRPDVEAITGLSRSSLYGMMAEGRFPRPVRIGKRAVGWNLSVVEEWLRTRKLSTGG